MCWERKWGKYISLIQDGSSQHIPSTSRFFSWWSCCHERIWNNYVKIHWKSMQVRFIIFLCTREYNSLGGPTRKHKVWMKTKSLRVVRFSEHNVFQRIGPNLTRKWPKWNEITQRIWLWMYQKLSIYPLLSL